MVGRNILNVVAGDRYPARRPSCKVWSRTTAHHRVAQSRISVAKSSNGRTLALQAKRGRSILPFATKFQHTTSGICSEQSDCSMNRRKFFKQLGIGAATAVAVAHGLEIPVAEKTVSYSTYIMGQDAIIGSYADYCSFSSLAIATAIDEQVENAAKELSEVFGKRVLFQYNTLVA
jgi:hypothetical protein